MNPNDPKPTPLDDALRWQLRALRREAEPARDLWPAIAARLAAHPQTPAQRRPAPWLTPLAMAASVLLVVGTLGWFFRGPTAPSATGPSLVQLEADGMTRQYQAALREVQAAPVPATLEPTVQALDRDVALIRAALARNPDSTLLLEQLRRTYAHRLALAQRMATALT